MLAAKRFPKPAPETPANNVTRPPRHPKIAPKRPRKTQDAHTTPQRPHNTPIRHLKTSQDGQFLAADIVAWGISFYEAIDFYENPPTCRHVRGVCRFHDFVIVSFSLQLKFSVVSHGKRPRNELLASKGLILIDEFLASPVSS